MTGCCVPITGTSDAACLAPSWCTPTSK
jgi:hypothetical protein